MDEQGNPETELTSPVQKLRRRRDVQSTTVVVIAASIVVPLGVTFGENSMFMGIITFSFAAGAIAHIYDMTVREFRLLRLLRGCLAGGTAGCVSGLIYGAWRGVIYLTGTIDGAALLIFAEQSCGIGISGALVGAFCGMSAVALLGIVSRWCRTDAKS